MDREKIIRDFFNDRSLVLPDKEAKGAKPRIFDERRYFARLDELERLRNETKEV